MTLYRLFVPKQAVGASLVYFDFFVPTTSEKRVELLSVQPVISGAVAVTGVVGVDLLLTRTTAVGTGGTAATYEGASTTACTISCHSGLQNARATDFTARLTPTGGATAGAVLGWGCVFTEETNSATYERNLDLARPAFDVRPIAVPRGTGFRVVQGDVASVGNIGFNVLFQVDSAPGV